MRSSDISKFVAEYFVVDGAFGLMRLVFSIVVLCAVLVFFWWLALAVAVVWGIVVLVKKARAKTQPVPDGAVVNGTACLHDGTSVSSVGKVSHVSKERARVLRQLCAALNAVLDQRMETDGQEWEGEEGALRWCEQCQRHRMTG